MRAGLGPTGGRAVRVEYVRTVGAKSLASAESVEDEDEVLVALADVLGDFVEYVGGPSWGHVLLSPLENLAAIEEPVVRNKVRRRVHQAAYTHAPRQTGMMPP